MAQSAAIISIASDAANSAAVTAIAAIEVGSKSVVLLCFAAFLSLHASIYKCDAEPIVQGTIHT
jgi:hypothetical protein